MPYSTIPVSCTQLKNELWVESVKIQVSVIDVGGKTYGLLYVILSKKTLVHVDKTYNQSSKMFTFDP